ncbi:hypothetical protein COM04_26025 [Bacillus wiedmannii]|uniref:Lipoprotein n=1 Tax=Bacillus cereus group sp. MS39 TaxID=3041344 RepID=A0AAU8FA66_9BACI|nr:MULTISPECIES: hypothetical protein [Bacillus cereus group]MBJ8115719.1 hypothetical protein [Bacillus cereus]RFB22593.1 hypothetical protein DZB85_19930 [Bacillus sp. LB(2018)]KAA0769924.1 hypothetical protein DN392_25230 [Bacillus sp. BB51/4]OAK26424.1 hypothetical protein A6283_25610 [Bacillus wiedmannii]PEP75829.1 hypothetical protein CN573_08520 [Bacillus wiedmannii]
MKSTKRLIQVILVSTPILILSGCFSSFSKDDLNQPIQEYLKTNYGIQGGFSVVETDNYWFQGVDHQTYVEMKKPYRAYPFLMIERGTWKILNDDSDDIYLEQFKGAYIEQHPEVVQVIEQIIKKYGLVKYPNKFISVENGPVYIFPYDNLEFNIIYSQELLDDFKKTQKIDTTKLLPTLIPSDPRRENYNVRYLGVVNFLFKFDMSKTIPKAQDLIEDFQKSGVLTKGIYNIDMLVDDSNGGSEYNNVALFEVDENGKYTIIASPKYGELENTYFYGDYAAKKI